MTSKLSKNILTVNGKRAGIRIDAGPWVSGVPEALIKIRSKKNFFPVSFRNALQVETMSDSREDYFEPDSIRLMPGHPLYETAKKLIS